MRSRSKFLIIVLFLMQLSYPRAQGPGSRVRPPIALDDPMFGISYTPDKVRYEPMPEKIKQLCPEFKRGQFWVYAQYRSDASEYYVVLGSRPGQDGDSLGATLEIAGSGCRSEDSTWMLSGAVPGSGYRLSPAKERFPGLGAAKVCPKGPAGDCSYLLRSAAEEAILRGLVRDAINRAAKAYGGEGQFKKKACVPSQMAGSESTPLVYQELAKFCVNSR